MVLLIDTREQQPLSFPLDDTLTATKTVTLPVGDYMAEFTDGTRPPLVFERKSLSDLFGTMAGGYPRFKREMAKAKSLGLHLILIIEGSLSDVLLGTAHSQLAGSSCVQKLFTLWIRYDLQPVFCRSKPEMSRYIVESYKAIGRNYTKGGST